MKITQGAQRAPLSTAELPPTRERILDEAARLFVARGYHGLSMREIAEMVGVSKAGLYYHFKDKEELFLAILDANLAEVARLALEAQRSASTARDQIRQLLRGILNLPPHQRALIRVASHEIAHISPAARAAFGKRYQGDFIEHIASILRGGMARGELRRLDAHAATRVLLGMMYPFLTLGEHGGAPGNGDVDLMLALFFEGAEKR